MINGNILSKNLRTQYLQKREQLKQKIDELTAQRYAGDFSEDNRRALNALECKLQAVEDRLNNVKRQRYLPQSYSINQ